MQPKTAYIAVLFAAAIVLLTAVYAVSAYAETLPWEQYLGIGDLRFYETSAGQTRSLEIRPLQSKGIMALEWKDGDSIVSQELIQVEPREIRRFSYFDGHQTWLMTPAEPVLKQPLQPGATWQWKGTISLGDRSYASHMNYRVAEPVMVEIDGEPRRATKVVGYGRIGDASVVRERLYAPQLGLVEEQTVLYQDGKQDRSVSSLMGLGQKSSVSS